MENLKEVYKQSTSNIEVLIVENDGSAVIHTDLPLAVFSRAAGSEDVGDYVETTPTEDSLLFHAVSALGMALAGADGGNVA